ncbi:MAG TPA: transcription antitermination factor NusB [Anaerolineae bacterium]|nr:transcription antitermination factor NusB [Anaerolineae bacterium]
MTKTKSKGTSRHKARELVLKSLYAMDCGTADAGQAFKELAGKSSLTERHLKFAAELFDHCQNNSGWADENISKLAKNWRLDRINYIDRNILRMAMIELNFMPDAPVKVVMNEAIELAKKYSTFESSGFVNGILDSFSKSLAENHQ